MVRVYARVRGLRRRLIHVPILTPRLSSYWINFVTPIPSAIARPLIEGLRNEVIVRDPAAREMFGFEPMSYEDSVRLALERWISGQVKTVWSTFLGGLRHREPRRPPQQPGGSHPGAAPAPVPGAGRSGLPRLHRPGRAARLAVRQLALGPARPARPADRRGGHAARPPQPPPAAGRGRGGLLARGGPGAGPAAAPAGGDEAARPGRLQFEVQPDGEDRSILTQTAFFEPKGLSGWWYWNALYPLHKLIFRGLARAVVRSAEKSSPQRHKEHKEQSER